MGRNKNKKKAKEQKAFKTESPTGEIAKSRSETSETSQPLSYASAAVEPTSDENKVTDNSMDAPAITANGSASDSACPFDGTAPSSPPLGIFEDDAVDVPFLSPPNLERSKEVDGSESEFSHLKKDEISNAGSPGQIVDKEPVGEDASKGKELEGEGGQSGDSPSKTQACAGTGTGAKPNSHLSFRRALPFQKPNSTFVRSITKADWDKMFDSETKEGNDVDTAKNGTQDGAHGTAPIHPAITVSLHKIFRIGTSQILTKLQVNQNLAQAFEDQEVALYESTVLLQDATDELDETKRERARLEEERDRFKKELNEACETLQSVHERRQKLQDEKDKHKMREADWEKEKERFEVQIEQLTKACSAGDGIKSCSASPPKLEIDKSSHSTGDASENAAPKGEIQRLQEQLKDSQDELKIFRAYRKRREDEHIYKTKIAACATENEKLHKFGGTLDLESRLYRTLKKLADFHDNGGPEPTSEEYAQMKDFKSCIDERRRIIFQARTHPDPRGFMKPYLDKWSEMARKGDCTFGFPKFHPAS